MCGLRRRRENAFLDMGRRVRGLGGGRAGMLALLSVVALAAEQQTQTYPLLSVDQSTFLMFMAAMTFFLPVSMFALRGGF